MTTQTYSTQTISPALVQELITAMQNAGPYGSVEIFIQNHIVTQVTIRNIKKTNTLSQSETQSERHNGQNKTAGARVHMSINVAKQI